MIKIAFCIRSTYKTRGGGDVIQMLKTKEYLERMDKDLIIEIVDDPRNLSYDTQICHIFNYSTTEDSNKFFEQAKSMSCKIVSSSIYWDYKILVYEFFSHLGFTKLNRSILKTEVWLANIINKLWDNPYFYLFSNKFRLEASYFVESSDLVLPNSKEEMQLLAQFLNKEIDSIPHHVVFNASEVHDVSTPVDHILEQNSIPSNYVLQVGRIEPIKNQLSVVRALAKHPEIPILFIGACANPKYYQILQKEAKKRGNVYFLKEIPHDQIYSFYKKALLHILPSLRESPGLVSLEALAMGCPCIVSEYPYAPFETYFDGIATAIDPLSEQSIRDAVLSITKGINVKALKAYDNRFKWDLAAKQTYDAYVKVLSK